MKSIGNFNSHMCLHDGYRCPECSSSDHGRISRVVVPWMDAWHFIHMPCIPENHPQCIFQVHDQAKELAELRKCQFWSSETASYCIA